MKRAILVCAAALLAAGMVVERATSQEEGGKLEDFMELKLDHSQEVLRGIVLEDFALIAKHSQELSLLSQAASWRVFQTTEYLQHSGEFRRTADALTEAARQKNLDAAALKYVDLTLKCVNCHKYVRGVRMAALDEVDAVLGN